jgi:TPR repeat protein
MLPPTMNGSRAATPREFLAAAVVLLCGCATTHAPNVADIRASAESGDVGAQVTLGDDYAAGRGVTQSYAEAARWYGRAADNGDQAAQCDLGALYLAGEGVAKDYAKALELFRKSAAQDSPKAEFNLGLLYTGGIGVTQDLAAGRQWYVKAAEEGSPEAMLNLGVIYRDGTGVTCDLVEAYKWIYLAVNFTDEGKYPGIKPRARAALKNLKPQLSKQQLEEAKERSQEWFDAYRES